MVDLSGHTNNNCLPVLAYKPAPVQISGIGWFNTTGLPAVDYFLADDYTDPVGMNDGYFTEKLLRLPQSHFCYRWHVHARILLARLCILEERTDDGLAVFDFILEHWQSGLTVEEKETMEDVLEYYGRNEAAKLQQDYPHIAAFLNITAESAAVVAESDQPMVAGASGASVADQLRALLEDHPEENEQVVEAAAPAAEQDETAETTRILQEIRQREISLREKIKILNDFAGSFYYQDDFSAAQEFLQEALHLDAQDSDTLRNLAYVYAAMGNKDM